MASFTGIPFTSPVYTSTPSNPALGGKDTNGDVDNVLASAWERGTLTDTQPVVEPGNAQTGNFMYAFGWLDWFERIHIEYTLLEMGNVVSTQVVEFEVFSTYFTTRTLNAITASGDEGLTLTPPASLPLSFAPWQSRMFALQVSTDGPPTIDATYTFDFDVRDFDLRVTGQRVIPWFVPPNWQGGILERLEFRTDVIKKFDGSEQRIALRGEGCQWFWEFRYNAGGATMRLLENALYAWAGRIWALPIFPQGQAIATAITQGATVIACDTADLDFRVGGLAILHDLNRPEVYEAFEVLEVGPSSVTAKRGLLNAWPVGTYLYPARTARMLRPTQALRFTSDHLYGSAQFRCEEQLVREPATETLYRGYPVQADKPDWSEDPSIQYARKLVAIDLGVGIPVIDDQSGLSEPVHAYRWTFTSRAAAEAYRRWLFARRGRQKALWLPTFANDVIVKATVNFAASSIDVEACGLALYVDAGINRRDLRIVTSDGQVRYRRVTAVATVDATTERLTLDSALGTTYAPSDFVSLSWMSLARLDADAIEIAHWSGEASSSLTALRSPRASA